MTSARAMKRARNHAIRFTRRSLDDGSEEIRSFLDQEPLADEPDIDLEWEGVCDDDFAESFPVCAAALMNMEANDCSPSEVME
jgi:hypothetical protein